MTRSENGTFETIADDDDHIQQIANGIETQNPFQVETTLTTVSMTHSLTKHERRHQRPAAAR